MSAFSTRSRKVSKLATGVALFATSALVLSACAADTDPGDDTTTPAADLDLTLTVGTALPVTGSLAFLGPPEEAGVLYAAHLINEADLGIEVVVELGDSGDLANQAYETEIPRLLGLDVDAIIGAASSGVSLQFIDQVIDADTIMFSPANTSADFTTYDDNGLYWRTAPSDVLQGEVLGNLIAADGHQTLAAIVLNDSYGTGLLEFTTEAFEAAGGEVVASPLYNTGDSTFDAQLSEILAADPDAIALITFDEIYTILPTLVSEFPAESLYFVDGNITNFGDDFPAGTLEGAKGTLPGLDVDSLGEFTAAVDEFWQGLGNDPLNDFAYAAESFDAVILLALAALAAESTDSLDIIEYLQEVSGGSDVDYDGVYTDFASAAEAILAGETVDYDGISGPITFDENGDPTDATIGIYIYDEENNIVAYEG